MTKADAWYYLQRKIDIRVDAYNAFVESKRHGGLIQRNAERALVEAQDAEYLAYEQYYSAKQDGDDDE